ncbi:uncharacterized protein LOC108808816 [Raphanus sativus]|uniref:Uncharacterized protein LOC108808816 n=1 Tax=Raphanus sativus TaxID=3726 RepID=A0A6J0JLA6_RAPSA|nr:uncharacterized protein LOC108808816 [Raphanus sativus]
MSWWDCIALPDDVDPSDESAFKMQIKDLACTKWMHWKAVLKYAKSDVNEWKMVEVQEESVPILMPAFHTSQRNNHTWRRPPLGWLKWNLDGSVYNTDTDASAGWILHDADGFYLYSVQAIERKVSTAMEVE